MCGASRANQFRFHLGYHYPRSKKTVDEIKLHFKEFYNYFGKNVFGTTNNYYGIAKINSKTNFKEYLHFLKKNKLKYKQINSIGFNEKQIAGQLISYEKNKGKGYAVKKGLEVANGKYIFFQDADLEYDPIELNKFASVINRFDPDVIIGSRFNYSEYTRSHSILNKFGNILITLIFNLFYNTTFTDIYSCYACFKKVLLDVKSLKTIGFE